MVLFKFIASFFVSFIVYSGFFYAIGEYLIRYYFAKDLPMFRAADEMGKLLPTITLLNFVNALVFSAGFLVFRKAMPGGENTNKGLLYGIFMPIFGGSILMMFYYYAVFNIKIEVSIIFGLCLLFGGIINGVLTGIIFGEKRKNAE
jgi:hypothetical protein